MYPCSNPELVAAVSEAGGIGVLQPLSMEYVHGRKLRDGLHFIRSLTDKPIGLNITTEKSSSRYAERIRSWLEIGLEEGCKFVVTSLGKPDWVVERARVHGALVFHKCTETKWAQKAVDSGVDGLIAVTKDSGGHAGVFSMEQLYEDFKAFQLPLVCAGGIGSPSDFRRALEIGYDGVLMGTRFIATEECSSNVSYKEAIVQADADDVVLTERVTGVPLSVIRTPHVEKLGLKIGPLARFLFKHPKTKHWIRTYYNAVALWKMKRSATQGHSTKDYYQAGKSVAGIDSIVTAGDVIRNFVSS